MFKDLQAKMAQEMRMVDTVNAGSDEDRANQRISFADNDDADKYGVHPSGNSLPRRTNRFKIYIIATVVVLLIVAAIAAAIAVQFATRRLVNICPFN